MTILTGRITSLTVGGNSIPNCKYIIWRTNHTITPQFLPSSKIPVGYLQSHISVEGTIGLQTHDDNLVEPSTADSPVISMIAQAIDTAGATETYTFVAAIIEGVGKDLGGLEPIFVYRFQAFYVTET